MKRMKWKTTICTAILALCTAVSCSDSAGGIAATDDRGEALWTLHASISGEVSESADANVRLAFIWKTGDMAQIAEDISLSGTSPLTADLEIFKLPDESILISSDDSVPQQFDVWEYSIDATDDGVSVEHPTVRWSQGKIVLYEDLNDNGTLDLLELGATDAVDRIVGGAFAYDFFYIETDLEHPFVGAPEVTAGLTMVSAEEEVSVRKPLAIEDEIVISLDDSRAAQLYMCPDTLRKHWIDGMHTESKTCTVVSPNEVSSYFPDGILLNVDGNCSLGGYIFQWFDMSMNSSAVCGGQYMHGDYYISRIPSDQEVPDNWPCEVSAEDETGGVLYFVEATIEGNLVSVFAETDVQACIDLTADLVAE